MCLKSDWCEGLDVTYDGASVSKRVNPKARI